MADIRGFFGVKGNGAPIAAKAKVITKSESESKAPADGNAISKTNHDSDSALVESCSTSVPIKENIDNNSIPKADNSVTVAINSNAQVTSSSSTVAKGEETIGSVTWKAGESVPYAALVETFEAVSNLPGRLDKEDTFCRLFKAVLKTKPTDLDPIVYLSSNTLSPAYDGAELGIGDSLLVKAICEATGRTKSAVDEAYEREGDLGLVALASRANQKTLSFLSKPKPLSAAFILDQLRLISQTKGDKAQGKKVDRIKSIMVKCQGNEAKFLIRALQGKLRIGTAAQTILVSLAHAFAECFSYLHPRTGSNDSCDTINATPSSSSSSSSSSVGKKSEKIPAAKTTSHAGSKIKNRKRIISDEDDDEVTDAVGDVETDKDSVEVKEIITTVNPIDTTTATTTTDETQPSSSASSSPLLDLDTLLSHITEVEPDEARVLREDYYGIKKLSKEEKSELAVIAVKRAFSECPNLSLLVSALLTAPLHQLFKTCRLVPGVPVHPMLAKPTKEIGEVLRRLSGLAFTMEYKYDGERAQVHLLTDGSVKIFSRNSEDNSEKYPDLRDIIKQAKHHQVTSFVIDAEVVAYDRERNCLLPFQILSTRKRKLEEGEEEKVRVVLQGFDMLYINGHSLLPLSLRFRRDMLRAAFTEKEGLFEFAKGSDHVENGDTAPIEAVMNDACAAMCEGLMVKTLDSNASYEPSKRSLNWLKLKKDYIDGMGVCDSVDLVVIGGYKGRGKRVNVYGAYLMACYDPDRDEFQSCCKVGTGFKDEDLIRLSEHMRPLIVESGRKPHNYNTGDPLLPDDWFTASAVWELQAADLSKSSVHKAGVGRLQDAGRGIGLRFPRFLRERPDKKPENATSAEQIVDIFFSQGDNGAAAGSLGGGGGNGEDEEEELI